jgi:hypothetical protein
LVNLVDRHNATNGIHRPNGFELRKF